MYVLPDVILELHFLPYIKISVIQATISDASPHFIDGPHKF